MNSILKNIGYSSIIEDIILIIFGVILMKLQFVFTSMLVICVGALFILKGIISFCRYAMAKGVSEFYNQELVTGLVSIAAGILVILLKNTLISILKISLGIYIVYIAINDFIVAYKMKKMKVKSWIEFAVISAILAIVGIIIIVYQASISTLGIIIIISAILDLVDSILFIKESNEIFK